jgi:protein phosphatase 2C
MARAQEMGAARASAARIAAKVLTRAAIEAGSRDNVTVVVVDLAAGSSSQRSGDDHRS